MHMHTMPVKVDVTKLQTLLNFLFSMILSYVVVVVFYYYFGLCFSCFSFFSRFQCPNAVFCCDYNHSLCLCLYFDTVLCIHYTESLQLFFCVGNFLCCCLHVHDIKLIYFLVFPSFICKIVLIFLFCNVHFCLQL